MARQAGADVIPVDVGMACRDAVPGVVNRKVAYGTKDFLEAPAMTREETVKAMEAGADMAVELKERGYVLAGSGEMGIGNTTTSSALLSVLLDMDPERVTGRGAGLTTAGYNRKVQVIREGIRIHRPSGEDPVDALSKVGGLDLAALTGFYIGCAACGLPVVLDGLITGAAALAAVRISPDVKEYLLASHVSAEPAGAMVLDALGLKPAISAGMCLGEGTGAAALLPLLDMAASVYTRMSSFDEIHVDAYEHLV
jgi:nicotinate-nucleotide--dimethylbenzimidazole phosphoribosyltransferase